MKCRSKFLINEILMEEILLNEFLAITAVSNSPDLEKILILIFINIVTNNFLIHNHPPLKKTESDNP